MALEIIFMLVILKIPIVYLCVVVWYAIKAEPKPPEPSEVTVVDDTPPADRPWQRRGNRPRPSRPHTSPRAFPSGPHRGGVHA